MWQANIGDKLHGKDKVMSVKGQIFFLEVNRVKSHRLTMSQKQRVPTD